MVARCTRQVSSDPVYEPYATPAQYLPSVALFSSDLQSDFKLKHECVLPLSQCAKNIFIFSFAIQKETPGHLQQQDSVPTTRHVSPSVVVGVVARPVATATCCQGWGVIYLLKGF